MSDRHGIFGGPSAVGDRLGVFGGTFDPIHLGHLILANELREALALDRVLFVPAGQPPHKPEQPVAAKEHRLAMLELALADNPAFAISRVDVDRREPSYTAVLLRRLADDYPTDRLFFLMGADSLRDLPTWHEPERIVALAELVVAARPGVAVDSETVREQVPGARGRVHLVATPLIEIAASNIRQRVAEGRSIRYLVPEGVRAYIETTGLYRAAPENA